MTVAFAIANAALVLVAPFMLGMGVSWEAHAGGYIAGALMMALLPVHGITARGGNRGRIMTEIRLPHSGPVHVETTYVASVSGGH